MAGLFEGNSQGWSTNFFNEALDSITSNILKRIDTFFQTKYIETIETTEDAILILDREVLNQELQEETEQTIVIFENKMEMLQNEKEEFLGSFGILETRAEIIQFFCKVLMVDKELFLSEGKALRKLYFVQQLQIIQDLIRVKKAENRWKKRVRKKVGKKD